MPEIPNVVTGEPVASDWGNDIRDRTVQRYATWADLLAEHPAPQDGDLAYVGEWNAITMYSGGAWGAVFAAGRGTEAAPTYSFYDDRDSGMYRSSSAPELRFSAAGVDVARFNSSEASFFGEVDVTPTTDEVLHVAHNQVHIGIDGRPGRLTVDRMDQVTYVLENFEIDTPPTTADAPNAVLFEQASGRHRIRLTTSARRYKSNIQPAPELADLELEPVTFHHDGDDKDYLGFIADDVAALDSRAGQFNTDGEVENYDLRAVVAILAAKVNRLEAQLATLN